MRSPIPLPRRGLRWYFDHNDGRMIDKWMHYFPIYERYLEGFRGRPITMLEIGISHGGSLQMWRWYFGRAATIVGIDIDPRVADLAEPGLHIHVGDQSDPTFLNELAARYGKFDIIIDDGGHYSDDQVASIETLWPHLKDDGIYVVEDLHANYWERYGGNVGAPNTFISWSHERIHDMHAFHSEHDEFVPTEWTRTIGAMHVYDSVIVFEKERRDPPDRRMAGRPSFDEIGGRPVDDAMDDNHRAQLASLSSPMARLRRFRRDPRGTLQRAGQRIRR